MATDTKIKTPRKKAVIKKGKRGVKHIVSSDNRQTVRNWAAQIIPHEVIAAKIGVDEKTLRKYYRDDLDYGYDMSRGEVGGCVFEAAKRVKDDAKFTGAAALYLKLIGAYTDRTDITTDGKPIGEASGSLIFTDTSRIIKKPDDKK